MALPLFGRTVQPSSHISQRTGSWQDRVCLQQCDNQQWQLSCGKTGAIFLKIFTDLQWWSLIWELPFSSCSRYLGTYSAQEQSGNIQQFLAEISAPGIILLLRVCYISTHSLPAFQGHCFLLLSKHTLPIESPLAKASCSKGSMFEAEIAFSF